MKPIVYIAIIVVVAIAGFLLLRPRQTTTSSPSTQSAQSSQEQAATSSQTISQNTVTYTDQGFSPSTLTVSAGTMVIFVNQSSGRMWVASNPHPTHTDLSGFDELTSVTNGGSYQFKFTKVGSFGYHNHLDPSQTGTIVVQ